MEPTPSPATIKPVVIMASRTNAFQESAKVSPLK